MFGYVTDEQFNAFKKRWNGIAEKGIESDIFESCQQLASTGELVPILYSAGYDDVKDTPRYKKLKVTNKTVHSRYILLGVKSGHTKLFTQFDQWRSSLHFDDWQKTKPTLSAGMLPGAPMIPEMDRVYFNYWMLEFKYKLSTYKQEAQVLVTPPWMPRMWQELTDYITMG